MRKSIGMALIGFGVGVISLASYIQFKGSNSELEKRFPTLPKDVVKKVHLEMLKEALAGEYDGILVTDSEYDDLFLAKAAQYL